MTMQVTQRGFEGELVIDCFAGGGGATSGIEAAIGRPVDIALNHNEHAIRMHETNHPETRHYVEDIWAVDPRVACGGLPVGLVWMSPDCKHFSRAKGTVPVDKKVRGLAWAALRWAKAVKPRMFVLENVEEFQDWGPLRWDAAKGGYVPDPDKKGLTFKIWLGKLRGQGYAIEYRSIMAADHGTPTTRKRLFIVARRDRTEITFPDATHSKKGNGLLPWVPAHAVLDFDYECKSIFNRKRPLAPATMNRIAMGIPKFVTGGDPYIVRHGHYSKRTGAGLVPGKGAGLFRGQSIHQPLATVCATNDKNLVVPLLAPFTVNCSNASSRFRGQSIEKPLGTVMTKAHHGLVIPWLIKHYGGMTGNDIRQTVGTITSRDSQALAKALLVPAGATDRSAQVNAFLIKYYGTGVAHSVKNPLDTVTTKDRFALVEVLGTPYRIVDIGMRMLQPRELYRAQGFAEDYQIDVDLYGRGFTKTQQTAMVGNSVCPQVAQAVIEEQLAA
jgi:DNA (cytosine-5)-methyltransferase 1